MTKVNCMQISCKSNKEGVCTKDEITLSDLFGGDVFNCEERDIKSKIFVGIDFKKRTWGIIKEKDDDLIKKMQILDMIKEDSVCPDLSSIEEKGKELNLREGTIIKAKNFAIEYFKKTDKMPKFPQMLMPAFLYIAAICACYEYNDYGERRTQAQIEKAFNISSPTIRKWYMHIVDKLHIEITI